MQNRVIQRISLVSKSLVDHWLRFVSIYHSVDIFKVNAWPGGLSDFC